LNYSTLLGISVGLSVVIPYVGAAIVTIRVAGVGLYQFGFNSTFGYLMASYIVIQILDGNVLVPKLFAEKMKLHPFIILASVLVFGSLWGFWGVFFAIPLATLIKTIFTLWPRGEYIEDKHLSAEQHV
jgi:putative permease